MRSRTILPNSKWNNFLYLFFSSIPPENNEKYIYISYFNYPIRKKQSSYEQFLCNEFDEKIVIMESEL